MAVLETAAAGSVQKGAQEVPAKKQWTLISRKIMSEERYEGS